MRTTRAFIAGLGTTGSLVAAIALVFVIASAVIAFNGWPGAGFARSVESLSVDDRPGSAWDLPVTTQVAGLAAKAAETVSARPLGPVVSPVAGVVPGSLIALKSSAPSGLDEIALGGSTTTSQPTPGGGSLPGGGSGGRPVLPGLPEIGIAPIDPLPATIGLGDTIEGAGHGLDDTVSQLGHSLSGSLGPGAGPSVDAVASLAGDGAGGLTRTLAEIIRDLGGSLSSSR
jgi:hypothetical protein